MSKPIRIQRKRAKGWKMPENTVYVGRPTKWGNPFKGEHAKDSFEDLVRQVRDDYNDHVAYCCGYDKAPMSADNYYATYRGTGAPRLDRIHELRGKNLACWCRLDQPCHADVLLEMANKETP